MPRQLISSGSPFEAKGGYSRAVVAGDWCFVAGTTGYDYMTMTMPSSVEDQARHALATIRDTLAKGGFEMSHIVRATYYIVDAADWERVAVVAGNIFGGIRPAATCIVAGLIQTEMKVEIEVTAFRG